MKHGLPDASGLADAYVGKPSVLKPLHTLLHTEGCYGLIYAESRILVGRGMVAGLF